MNHQIMDRWAMLKYQAIHGKTFGLFLEFPILPRKISFPKRTKRHGPQIPHEFILFNGQNLKSAMLI